MSLAVLAPGLAGVAYALASTCSGSFCSIELWMPAAVFGGIGYWLLPVAVAGIADLAGGRGNAGGAYLGLLIGSGLWGASLAVALSIRGPSPDVQFGVGGAIGGVLALACVVGGYEIWDAVARSSSTPTLVPTASVTSDGVSVGVAGSF